jgi:hypothetical protein
MIECHFEKLRIIARAAPMLIPALVVSLLSMLSPLCLVIGEEVND